MARAACAAAGERARVLWGSCDGLVTPRPLAPLLDLEGVLGPIGPAASGEGARHDVFTAVLRELSAGSTPTLLVIDDAHWADTATVDLIGYLGRRVAGTRGVLVVTYRDDEVARDHPLRLVLAEVARGPAARRVALPPLTGEAVSRLASAAGLDGEEVFRLSGGNPYVVSELLADPGGTVHSVRDVVITRASRLSGPGRQVLDAAAVMAEGAEPAVLVRAAGSGDGLDECAAAGLLRPDGHVVRFRHELARLAVLESLPPHRRVELHRAVLMALLDSGLGDPARCAHYAEAAGHAELVLRHAPRAADRAIALGSHPEAVAQLERALRFAGGQPAPVRAALLETLAEQYLLVDRCPEALRTSEEALAGWRGTGDVRRLGLCLQRRAEILRYSGDSTGVLDAARAAIVLLEPLGEGPDLARALARLAQMAMLVEDVDLAVATAVRAAEMAQRFADEATVVHALNTEGSARAIRGEPQGLDLLDESLRRSRAAGLDVEVGRAMNNVIHQRLMFDRLAGLRAFIAETIAFAEERGLDIYTQCIRGSLAIVAFLEGSWDEAAENARHVLAAFGTSSIHRIEPLYLIGALRARRGDPDPDGPLLEALDLARRCGGPQALYPSLRALAESAWLAGDPGRAARNATEAAGVLRHAPGHPRTAEAAYWCWRSGVPGPTVDGSSHPFALPVAGRPVEAARAWHEMGSPTRRPMPWPTARTSGTGVGRGNCSTPWVPRRAPVRSPVACGPRGRATCPAPPAPRPGRTPPGSPADRSRSRVSWQPT